MLLTLLMWAWAQGVRSSRRIERACEQDIAFRVICAGDVPDHVTISRWQLSGAHPVRWSAVAGHTVPTDPPPTGWVIGRSGYDRDAPHWAGVAVGSGGDRGDRGAGRADGGGRLRDRCTVVQVHRGDDRGGPAGVRRRVPGRGHHQQHTDDGRLARCAGRDGVRITRVRHDGDGTGAAVTVTVARGVIDDLAMTGPDGAAVAGTVSADRTSWTLGQNLAFGASYTVTGTATGTDGRQVPITGTFSTAGTDTALRNTVYPGDGAVVGVAAPVIVYFGVEPADKAAVAAHVRSACSFPGRHATRAARSAISSGIRSWYRSPCRPRSFSIRSISGSSSSRNARRWAATVVWSNPVATDSERTPNATYRDPVFIAASPTARSTQRRAMPARSAYRVCSSNETAVHQVRSHRYSCSVPLIGSCSC